MTAPLCRCGRPLPQLAIDYHDAHCSSTCARAAAGCPLPKLTTRSANLTECGACGGPIDEITDGCKACVKRQVTRRNRRKGTVSA